MSIVPSTIAATQGAKQGQAGLASGLVNTSRQVGGGLGIAVLITLATSLSSHLIGQGHGVPAGAHRRLPARLLHRRRPVRRGRGGHVRARARGSGAAAQGPLTSGSPIAIGVTGVDRRVRRARVRVRRLARRADRRVHDRATPTATSPSRPPPAGHSRRHQDRDSSKLAPGYIFIDELLRPQPPADRRPERAADPRQPPPAGVVQAGADERRRRQPQPPGLQRQAGARLVAGRDHQHRRHRDRART